MATYNVEVATKYSTNYANEETPVQGSREKDVFLIHHKKKGQCYKAITFMSI